MVFRICCAIRELLKDRAVPRLPQSTCAWERAAARSHAQRSTLCGCSAPSLCTSACGTWTDAGSSRTHRARRGMRCPAAHKWPRNSVLKLIILLITRLSCQEAMCVLQTSCLKAATILPLVGLNRSKQGQLVPRVAGQMVPGILIWVLNARFLPEARCVCRPAAGEGSHTFNCLMDSPDPIKANLPWERCSVFTPTPASQCI